MDTLAVRLPELREAEHVFTYEGKRGKIILRFDLLAQGEVVGRGEKHMLVSRKFVSIVRTRWMN